MSPGMAEASCLRIFLSETQSLNPQPRPQPVTSLSHLLLYLSAARFITAPELPDSSRPPPPNPNPAAPLTGRRQARARRSERGGAGRGGRCWPPIGRWVGRGRGGGCEGAGRARGRGLARLPQLPAGAGGPGSAPPCGEQVGLRGGGGMRRQPRPVGERAGDRRPPGTLPSSLPPRGVGVGWQRRVGPGPRRAALRGDSYTPPPPFTGLWGRPTGCGRAGEGRREHRVRNGEEGGVVAVVPRLGEVVLRVPARRGWERTPPPRLRCPGRGVSLT